MGSRSTTQEKSSLPGVLEVADLLRKMGYKGEDLWDKHPSKWIRPDVEVWENLKKGIKPSRNKRAPRNSLEVVRLRDGRVFASGADCIKEEGIPRSTLTRILKLGRQYIYKKDLK